MKTDAEKEEIARRKLSNMLEIRPYRRNWAVYDLMNKLVCVTVYKRGAEEVLKRFG